MNSGDLSKEQARQLHAAVSGHYVHVAALVERCQKNGFPEHDIIFACARDAKDKLHNLTVHLHSLSCEPKQHYESQAKRPACSERQQLAIKALEAVGWRHVREGHWEKPERCKKGDEWVIVEVDGTVHPE